MNMEEIETKLGEKMGKEELEAEIQKKIADGAKNRQSAVNKVYKEQRAEKVGDTEFEGLYLGATERRFGGYNIWVATKEDVARTTTKEQPTAGRFEYVKVQANILENLEGKKWTEMENIIPLPDEAVNINEYMSPVKDGMVFTKAIVRMVSEVSIFEDGKPIKPMPVFDEKGVNLRMITSIDNQDVTIKIHEPNTLAELIGDISWIEDAAQEESVKEISDMLRHTELLVFGRYVTEIDGKAIRPFVDTRHGFIKKL